MLSFVVGDGDDADWRILMKGKHGILFVEWQDKSIYYSLNKNCYHHYHEDN